MKKISGTQRIVKDMMFLRSLPSQQIAPGIIKRLDVQGTGQTIKDMKVPCIIYISLYKYDYEGRFNGQILNLCIRDFNKQTSSEIGPGVYIAVKSMKLQQKSWFNFQSAYLHRIDGLPHEGCHFYIVVDDIKYKSTDTFESKRIVSEQCRKQAKKLFEQKDFEKALKLYKKQINITEGINKKNFQKEELEQMSIINEKAKKNFLRCFAKLTHFDESLSQAAQKYSKELLKKYPDQELILLFRIHVLKQTKYLTQALQMAEQMLRTCKTVQNDVKLVMDQLKQKIKDKDKK